MKLGKSIEVQHAWLLWFPWALFATGFALNAIVMGLNHGLMPVLLPGVDCSSVQLADGVHSCMTRSSHLKFLADWIMIGSRNIASPGDLLEQACDLVLQPFIGAWVAIQCFRVKRN